MTDNKPMEKRGVIQDGITPVPTTQVKLGSAVDLEDHTTKRLSDRLQANQAKKLEQTEGAE